MHPHTVIFIGPQGSGKGTQIERLGARLKSMDPGRDVVDTQSGRAFRNFAETGGGYAADRVRATLDTGALQPLFLSVVLWGQLMIERVTPDCHLLIEGFPRTIPQATVLESAFAFYGREKVSVIHLDAPEHVVRERMEKRARSDDTKESIEERLRWYQHETLHVIEYYRSRRNTDMVVVDGTGTVEEVHGAIVAGLNLGTEHS